MNKKTQKLGVEAKKPEIIYNSKEYKIEKIPLNYRITINTERKSNKQAIERECYTSLKYGLEYAHEVAREQLEAYFTHRFPAKVKRNTHKGKFV